MIKKLFPLLAVIAASCVIGTSSYTYAAPHPRNQYTIHEGALPHDSTTPLVSYRRSSVCQYNEMIPGTTHANQFHNHKMIGLPQAWRFSKGRGQTVAVLDTGVANHHRLPHMIPGADYIVGGDGHTDCDGLGTLEAGIINAFPGRDKYTGVAPAARLMPIRITSSMWQAKLPHNGNQQHDRLQLALDVMARAIVHAANAGATVIEIGQPICAAQDDHVNVSGLGAALHYAAVRKNVVIISAASNTGDAGCVSDDKSAQGSSVVPSYPGWFNPYVLTVSSVTGAGQPSRYNLRQKWVDVAAPGERIYSLRNNPGPHRADIVNGVHGRKMRINPIDGTRYAAAYVAGVAALVRAKYPHLTAYQVVNRILVSAHRSAALPSENTGYGIVDAYTALTWQIKSGPEQAQGVTVEPVPIPPQPVDNKTPMIVSYAVAAGLLTLLLIILAVFWFIRTGKKAGQR